eukprot:4652432-Pyramimonas_sp.AAC.1
MRGPASRTNCIYVVLHLARGVVSGGARERSPQCVVSERCLLGGSVQLLALASRAPRTARPQT